MFNCLCGYWGVAGATVCSNLWKHRDLSTRACVLRAMTYGHSVHYLPFSGDELSDVCRSLNPHLPDKARLPGLAPSQSV